MITYEHIKRVIDILLVIFLGIIFLPFWVIVPSAILILSGWPIIYKHRRVGKDGKGFWLYKFRTMVKNADEILFKKRPDLLRRFKQSDWKLEDDPRVTKLGRLMRSLTIDEFPQLYNVLTGEMSIVGYRPYVKKELEEQMKKYPITRKWIKEIFQVKPGITGPWQTSGRNIVPFDKRAEMDVKYAREQSFWKDLKILLKTPKAMVSKW